MAFTDALDKDVGDATQAADHDSLADNTEFNREKADVEHHFDISTGDGAHKTITFNASTDVIRLEAGAEALPSLTTTGDLNTGIWFPAADTVALSTAGSERVRVNSSGNVGIGDANPSHRLSVGGNTNGGAAVNIENAGNSSPSGVYINFSGASPDNNTQTFLECFDSTTQRCKIFSDGDLANHDGTYGTISDAKFKQDIVPARSYWDDFKALPYVKWRDKVDVERHGDGAPYRLGLVAQEAEKVFPACVPESPDNSNGEEGETYKWIKSSIIEGPIMARVVQELQQRVEALENS
jgi:hypothetical protein